MNDLFGHDPVLPPNPDWRTEMMYRSFEFMRYHEIFTSEDIKLSNLDLGPPPHKNIWGDLAVDWVNSCWCVKTDKTTLARSKQSKGHKLNIYRSLVYKDKK